MSKATRIERESPGKIQRKIFDWKLGYALLGDRRVPLRYKVAAFAIGLAGLAILGLVEFPLEEIIALVPFLGIIADVSLDGFEAVIVPILLTCLTLPYLVPSNIVDLIRRERSPGDRPPEGPIIDV